MSQDERRRDFGIVEFPFVLTPVSKAGWRRAALGVEKSCFA